MRQRTARYVPLILIGLAAGAEAQTTPVISLAMHYTHARDRMLEAGFKPFRIISPNSDAYKRNFAFREDIARKFPEALECAPAGKSPCNFLFQRGANEIVEITTVGEHAETLIVRKVHRVTLEEANRLYSE